MLFQLFTPLLLAATALAAPHTIRRQSCDDTPIYTTDNSTSPSNTTDLGAGTTFRFLGSVYCLVPTTNVTFGPCSDIPAQVQLNFTENNNQTALTTVLGHAVNVTKEPAFFYGNYYVTIDGVLRNATGQDGPSDLFGAGITRSYDYPL